MDIRNVPFITTYWEDIPSIEHKGKNGSSFWKTVESGNIRVRIVEYTQGFESDHWCSRGHILLVLEGEFNVKLKDGREYCLPAGSGFQVEDDENNSHFGTSPRGAKVFIVD